MTAQTTTPPVTADQPTPGKASGKSRSLWQEAMQRLVRNRAALTGGIIIILLILTALFADLIAPYSFEKQSLLNANAVPDWVTRIFPSLRAYAVINNDYPIGADKLGRDLFSRIVYGTRVSLAVAFIGPLISLIIGVLYGSISGFFGGRVDNIMMRVVDVLYAFPGLLFIILLMAFFRTTLAQPEEGTFPYYLGQLDAQFGGLLFIMIGIGLTGWETQARLTRGQVLSVREKEYIEAARAIGATNGRIMFQHILPNILGPLIVLETLSIPGYIYTEAFLSFIGLGVNPPTPSWGSMIADGSRALRAYPNQALFPAFALALTMFAFNFLGDGLRDALEPRLRGTQEK
ncbi:MAG TPA: ABC transporter permease [Anaerolineales bacterium]|nr:ABC transporter permease [Anaerolineales bacterium]